MRLPAGSPYNRYFPQESCAFHCNQLTAKKSTLCFNTAFLKKVYAKTA
jgi:hypothetical protein